MSSGYMKWNMLLSPHFSLCRVELCTELFYAIIPTLFLYFFADLLSLHLVTFLMFFILVYNSRAWPRTFTQQLVGGMKGRGAPPFRSSH